MSDLKGNLLITSKAVFKLDSVQPNIKKSTLRKLKNTAEKRLVELSIVDGQKYRSSYSYIKDAKFKPLLILNQLSPPSVLL